MTIIKDLTFPNTSLAAYEEDPAVGDTEVVESMSGITFRNARRLTPRRKFRVTAWGTRTHADIVAILALKEAVQGRLYAFYFTPPWEETPIAVCFTDDEWTVQMRDVGPDNTAHMFEIDCEMEEVIDGVPE